MRRPDQGAEEESYVEVDPSELSALFAAPGWLRDLGISAWLLVGVAAALAGAVWFLAVTQTIVMPVLTAAIIASVASPLVGGLERRRVPRAAGAVIVFLAITVVGLAVGLMILSGIASQASSITSSLQDGAGEIENWAKELGVDPSAARDAKDHASSSLSDGFKTLTKGLALGIEKLAGLAVFLSFTALALFFLLKDGPAIGGWVERHLGVPQPLAHSILGRVAGSLRGYFVGVTIVAAWSALLVGAGALLLGVPQAGTIAVVTFVGGYVPYLGAWAAGAFAVLIALGGEGPESAAAMAVIVLLANGILQQIVQPVAYGSALGLHPLAVLIVTVAGGCLFGTIGLVLAAPLVSAVVKISADVSAARAAAEERPAPEAPETAPPAPA